MKFNPPISRFLCRLLLLISIAIGYGIPAALAATPAGEAYASFNRLRTTGAAEDAIYSALHECFKTSMSQLDSSASGSQEYAEARTILTEIHPFLRSGAFYSSSKNNQNNALVFACAYMDVPLHDAFKGVHFDRDDQFANLAYFAASGVYNRGDKAKAIPYFQVYLDSGDQKHRKDVFTFMAKACIDTGDRDRASSVLRQAINAYPSDFNLLSVAVNNSIESGDNESLQEFVTKALTLRPSDETLLNIQGKLYEDTHQFQNALNLYVRLQKAKPNSLQVAKHVALNYYNLGAMNFNKAQIEAGSGNSKKLTRQAKEYFSAAAATLEDVVKSDPSAVMYIQALATAYSCLGETAKLHETNSRLASMGMGGVEENTIPQMMAFNEKALGNGLSNGQPANLAAAGRPSSTAPASVPAPVQMSSSADMPKYSDFAKKYVESNVERWQAKDPYETVAEYQERVTEATRDAKVKELLKEAEAQYIATYTKGLRFNDMSLKPYDAENEVFLVESNLGELIVPVPRSNGEARVFESGWAGMQFKNPEYYINNDRLLLSSLTFVTPTGKSYRFDADKALDYTETVVDVSFGKIEDSLFAQNSGHSGGTPSKRSSNKVSVGKVVSDVDKDIPVAKKSNDKTFAVIIANENYSMVAPVPHALNDGEMFSKYCSAALGLPENNVRLYKDASFGNMLRAVRDIKDISNAFSGDIQVIFYYAGHGIPNEATKDAYLLPIDADGMTTDGCYSLKRLYSELGDLNAKSTVVFLDACFSGANRDGDMLASARGVSIKPKNEAPKGNMVIFSAATDEETAFPYQEKGHGLFTYFLLKKLKESKGNVELGDLAEYLRTNVRQQAVVVNRKPQTPTVSPGASLTDTWRKMKLGQ